MASLAKDYMQLVRQPDLLRSCRPAAPTSPSRRLNIYTKTVSTFVFSKVPRVFSKVLTVFTKVLTVLTGVPGGFQQHHTFTAGGATVLSRSRNHAGQTARAI